VVDGHHRVAAAILRGERSIPGKVWEESSRGLPDPLRNGWEDYDPQRED
jgi:hypothetical protein